MGLFEFFVIVVVIGLVVWAIHTFTNIDPKFKLLILWAGIFVCLMLLAQAVGLWGHDVRIPRIGGR